MIRRFPVMLAAALLLTACAAPSARYVNADSYGMYLALPRAWVALPDQQLQTAQSGWNDDVGQVYIDTVLWQKVWGPAGVTPKMAFAAKPSSKPTVYAFVRDLLSVEQRQIGDDIPTSLQNVIIPASTLEQDGVTVETERWHRGAFIGIHQRASYTTGGGASTVEVVSMLSPNKQRLYVLVMRCSKSCYADNAKAFGSIVDSLTFKETRG